MITNILKLNKLENQQIFPDKRTINLGEQFCVCLLDISGGDISVESALGVGNIFTVRLGRVSGGAS